MNKILNIEPYWLGKSSDYDDKHELYDLEPHNDRPIGWDEENEMKVVDISESFTCKHCGCNVATYKEKGPHIGRYCAHCGKWDKWMPIKDKSDELHQMSIEEFLEETNNNNIESLYDTDDLPWE